MTNRKFEPGDVVQAVIDGREMTVLTYDALGNVVCRWFDRLQAEGAPRRLQQATFAESRLTKIGDS